MKTVCDKNSCTGCMACAEMCPVNAIHIQDDITAYNAIIDTEKCINCKACYNICQNNYVIDLSSPIHAYQGWICDEKLRTFSSSGGAAMALSRAFIEMNGIICSCTLINGSFSFRFAETLDELSCFTGSKYVKSNPFGIYQKLIKLLKMNKPVLFIGLPCQIAGIKKAVSTLKEELRNNLYTVDLICHGTPSPKLLNAYLEEKGFSLGKLKDIRFRNKSTFGLSTNGVPLSVPGSCDHYSLAFLCGFIYTDNCYKCKYASIERCSDITIGDSWGTELDKSEKDKGISLILCQSSKGEKLLENSNMKLYSVNLETAIKHNAQLRSPSLKTKLHDKFFYNYFKYGFIKSVLYCLPFKCFKQRIKGYLIRLNILPFRCFFIP